MSVEEFWRGDPDLFWAYRFSYVEREKRNNQIYNYQAWLQGAYFYEGISVALSKAFGGDKTIEYSSEPYNFDSKEDTKNNTPKQNILEERLKARAKKIEKLLEGNDKNE